MINGIAVKMTASGLIAFSRLPKMAIAIAPAAGRKSIVVNQLKSNYFISLYALVILSVAKDPYLFPYITDSSVVSLPQNDIFNLTPD
jgi:hypothetical protein